MSSPSATGNTAGGSGGSTPTIPTSTLLHNKLNGLIFKSKEELIETTSIAGKFSHNLQKLSISKEQFAAIIESIKSVAQVGDISLLIIVGWGLVPLTKLWYETLMAESSSGQPPQQQQQYEGESSTSSSATRPFEKTKIYHFFNTLSEIAKLAMLVYAADILKIFLLGAGFEITKNSQVTHAFAYVVYTIWAFVRVSKFKHYVLRKMVTKSGTDPGRIRIINRFTDAGLFVLGVFALYEILNVQMGIALRGVVAVGSVWTLVVSLAMKEIAR
jgi:hypothetical protein